MQYLFITTELVGEIDNIERYSAFQHYVKWCTDNIDIDSWVLDYSTVVIMVGVVCAGAIRIMHFTDAINFARL